MANLTREDILARKVGKGTCELPGGGTVAVRSLTFAEVSEGQTSYGSPAERTAFYLSKALVDPKMTYEEVTAWQDQGDAGDVTVLAEYVQELSRLSEGAGKSRVPRAGKRR